MKKFQLVLALLLLSTATYVTAGNSSGTITFSGQIVPAQTGQQLTTIQPETSTASDGTTTTQYAVVSAPTGQTLATFPTLTAAQQYASQVTVAVAYRQ